MANYVTITSDKKKRWALFWCVLFGIFGAHYFYVGRRGKGFLYLFTLGLGLFGWFHDIKVIRRGKFQDNVGQYLRQW